MYFLGLGIVLLLLKWLELTFVAQWPWWQVLIPFGLAAVWWTWADRSGFYKRGEMRKEQARKQERIKRHRANLHGKPSSRR